MVKETSIPEGRPASGRVWKSKQKERFSAQQRKGFLKNLSKTFEEKEEIRKRKQQMLQLERELKEEKKAKKQAEIQRREERKKIVMANEFKSVSYQVIKPEKMKGMSKKQLRAIKKTSMNQNGQIELVSPWAKK